MTGFESLIPSLTLPDANDRHVLAAAIAARADVIVTFNMRHFPQPLLDPYQVTSTRPDAFLIDLLDADPVAVVAAAQTVRRRRNAPPQTADQFIQALTNDGLRRFSTELARHKDQL